MTTPETPVRPVPVTTPAPAAAPPPPAAGGSTPTIPYAYHQAPVGPPPAAAKSNGCLKATLIGLGVASVLSVLVLCALYVVGRKAVEDFNTSFGVAAAADYKLDVTECGRDDFEDPVASGTIVNKSSHRQGFEIKIDFVDADGTKLAGGTTFTGGIEPGQTATWRVPTLGFSGKGTPVCKVVEVDYSPF